MILTSKSNWLFAIAALLTSADAFTPLSLMHLSSSRKFFSARILAHSNMRSNRKGTMIRKAYHRMALDHGEKNNRGSSYNLIQDFLTQRSVQTLMHNLQQVGESTSLEYLESFLDHQGLSQYHGYGGLRTDSENYLSQLQKEIPFSIIIKKQLYRGGSPNNPYVKANELTYSTTIQPRALWSTIVSMRESLAQEWIKDLELLEAENAELRRHHAALIRNSTDHYQARHPVFVGTDDDSPLRLATYDLLEKLATEVAVRNVARELSHAPSSASRTAGRWLLTRFESPLGEGFRGDHGPDVGRTFMRALLAEVPSITGGAAGEPMILLDPHDLAERVMVERERLAIAWAKSLADTNALHLRWTVAFLERCLSRTLVGRLDVDL